ncbi:hypothetical protein [Bernardetia sp.]|uniref:hypothetical protein n=1 Tax=Bernardetia sp. TaxID=1937974 RepID=UPI0025BC825D|nr:hypothetical protein [Bernardetia sp.]
MQTLKINLFSFLWSSSFSKKSSSISDIPSQNKHPKKNKDIQPNKDVSDSDEQKAIYYLPVHLM